jgi:hypothetical protein
LTSYGQWPQAKSIFASTLHTNDIESTHNMKENAALLAAAGSRVLEFKDGQLHAQWQLDSQTPQQVSTSQRPSGLKQLLLSAFMPEGWPDAVTPDYTGTEDTPLTISRGLSPHL